MNPPVAVATLAGDASPMSEAQKRLAFMVMALGMFIALLDVQIVASSLAEIGAGLAATPNEIALVQTWYLIPEVIMIPLSGWLSRMASTRWLFTLSAAGFTLASVACGLAWNLESMILFRALQGFIGGAMIPTAFATGFVLFPGPRQGTVAAILGIVATCAPALGPTIGGYVTETLGWRWLFFINLLPGVLIVLLLPRLMRIDEPDLSLLKRFDVPGMIALALFLGGLQYVLEEGPRRGWLEDAVLSRLLALSLVAGVLFVWRSLGRREPLVDLRALRHRNFAFGCVLSFITGIGLYGMVYLTSLYLGLVRGWNSLQIGATIFTFGLSQLLATPLIAVLARRVDVRAILVFGFALYGISTCMLGRITAEWGFAELLASQLLRGIASMSCIIPVTNLALGALPPAELKNASGLFNLMRNLGGAIGLASLSTLLFYDRYALHYARLSEQLTTAQLRGAASLDGLAARLSRFGVDDGRLAQDATALFSRLLQREVLTLSFADCFLLVGACFFAALLLIPWIRPAAGPMTVHGGE